MFRVSEYCINEYLLVLQPHEDLWNKIMEVKKDFYDRYELATTPTVMGMGKPHITLARFVQLEMMEERIFTRLKNVASSTSPFKVELKDYGSFPSHTIYINVATKDPIRNLIKQIKPWQRLLKLDNDNKPYFIDDPHLSIARKLLPWQYEKGWLEYSHLNFTGRFIANDMLLLKRKQGGKAYSIAGKFSFMNMPVEVRQCELFGPL